MAQKFQSPESFSVGQQLTASRLNNMVNGAIALPELITDQPNLDAGTLASNDSILIVDSSESGSNLREARASDFITSNLPIVTSSITGQATQVAVTGGTGASTYYNTSDITITPNDSAIVSGKNYFSYDSSNVVVTSTSHGLQAGQLVTTSAATPTTAFNGTFRIVAANTDTFTYSLPIVTLPSSGTFSTSNGTLVTVTTTLAHGLSTGNQVAFTTSNSALNGTYTITVPTGSTTTFTYTIATAYGVGSGTFSSSDNQYTVVTTATNHNLVSNTSLAITASPSGFSGTYPITVLSGTSFAYSLTTPFGASNASAAVVGSTTTITITKTGHGLSSGNTIILTSTSGSSSRNAYISGTYIINVIDANTFTYAKSSTYREGYSYPSFTQTCIYVLSNTTTGTVTYAIGNPYTDVVNYIVSPVSVAGTLSYKKKGSVQNTANKIINGNLYVDGTSTFKSDIQFVGNMTNFGNVIQNGALTQNGNVTMTGSVTATNNLNVTGNLKKNGNTVSNQFISYIQTRDQVSYSLTWGGNQNPTNLNGTEIVPLTYTVTPKKTGNIMILDYSVFYEVSENCVFNVTRNDVLLTNSSDSSNNTWAGIVSVVYDTDTSSTPSIARVRIIDTSTLNTSSVYKLTIRSSDNSTKTFYLNRAYSSAGQAQQEIGLSSLIATEIYV
jgi:hypothetical protein